MPSIDDKLTLDGLIVQWVDVTPEIAEEWLGKNHGNRVQRPNSIAAYARDMSTGDWLQTGAPIRFSKYGVLIDGQHRLEAVIRSGVVIRELVISGLSEEVQGVLDTNVKRSAADALRFSGVTGNLNVIAAVARLSTGFSRGMYRTALAMVSSVTLLSNTEVVTWVKDNPEALECVREAARLNSALAIRPAFLSYAIMKTRSIDHDASEEFWSSISLMRTDGEGDPRLSLVRALSRMKEDRRTSTNSVEPLYLVAKAWNAWRAGETIQKFHTSRNGKAATFPEWI